MHSGGHPRSRQRCEDQDSFDEEPSTSSDVKMPEFSSVEEEAAVQLEPFIHQVGGHSCVLRFNETTLCKPMITREHLFYESLPSELKEFIPDYRGIIEVELQEDDDGHMTLVGYPNQDGGQRSSGGSSRSSPKGFERGTSPTSSGSENETSISPVMKSKSQHAPAANNSYSIRILRSGSIEVSSQTDTVFHSPDPKAGPKSAGLNPWSLKCHKRQLAKMRNDNHESNLRKFILLENVAARFQYPCILDLKMGTRQHGDDAPEAKKTSQMRKCANTTSAAVGLRLIGSQVYHTNSGQFVCQNKYYGRKLTVDGLKKGIELFLYNGEKLRSELLGPILARLRHLYSLVQQQDTFRFYSSSLLIMYGGIDDSLTQGNKCDDASTCGENVSDLTSDDGENLDNGEVRSSRSSEQTEKCKCSASSSGGGQTGEQEGAEDSCDNNMSLVDVRMIDFAHSTHRGFQNDEPHSGVDQGYLFGLKNLIVIFEDIQKRCGQQSAG